MQKALIHVKSVRRPISEEIIGFRLEAAIPNMEGRKMKARSDGESVSFYATQESAPSFKKPYFIADSSDYGVIDRRKMERFMDNLKWHGFKEFELVGNYDGKPLMEVMR